MSWQSTLSSLVPFTTLVSAIVSLAATLYVAISSHGTKKAQAATNAAIEMMVNMQQIVRSVDRTIEAGIKIIDTAGNLVDQGRALDHTLGVLSEMKKVNQEIFTEFDILDRKLKEPYAVGIPAMQREVGGSLSRERNRVEEFNQKIVELENVVRQAAFRLSIEDEKDRSHG